MENDEFRDWENAWEELIAVFVQRQLTAADSSHDIQHVKRVVENAKKIGKLEGANPEIFLPAAWLHDCFVVPKNSPLRGEASRLAAEIAKDFLQGIRYPTLLIPAIEHAIRAHSFSANLVPATKEAQVVQDADRLEALGAIGLARCLMTAGAMGGRLYDSNEPFPIDRPTDERLNAVDHFFEKLLRLPATMKTAAGSKLAKERASVLVDYLKALASEISVDQHLLNAALDRFQIKSESFVV